MGGFYERLVALIKEAMKKSLGPLRLTLIQLQTVVIQIESILNSRPLVYVGSELESGTALTPARLMTKLDSSDFKIIDEVRGRDPTRKELIDLWKRGQRHLDQYWDVFRNLYLKGLREKWFPTLHQPHCKASSSPKVGDIVHIKGSGNRGTWKLGKILELHEGADGKIRSAKVLCSGSILSRAIAHLYPLEIDDDQIGDQKEIEF